MFAVPGWSLGPLKREEPRDNSSKSSKKRKRANESREDHSNERGDGRNNAPTASRDFTGHGAGELAQRHRENGRSDYGNTNIDPAANNADPTMQDETQQSHEKSKKKKRQKQSTLSAAENSVERTSASTSLTSHPSAPPKLTPMQAAMRQKLISARFRHLNQTLYTAPSAEADQLFQANPSFFEEYHSGFRQQVASWPENPVDSFVRELKQRGAVRSYGKQAKYPNLQGTSQHQPLPRSSGTCIVADLGCGDARLVKELRQSSKKLNIRVLSYDLQSDSPLVTKADISRLPLEDGRVNVAIFCLALMGTNWIEFVEEAWRVLHWKGELWVAEIKSRFARAKDGQVAHSIGKRRKPAAKDLRGGGKGEEVEDEEEQLRVEVDGSTSTKGQTDVSTFVKVLERRGFALSGHDGIDLSNRMFVRLHFTKSKPPTKGRHAKPGNGTREDESDLPAETAALKPCFYKIR